MSSRSRPALDAEILETLRSLQSRDGSSVLQRIAATFLESAPELIEALRAAIASKDAEALAAAAHALRSSSGNVGATAVAERAGRLEELGRSGSLGDAKDELALLERDYAPARSELEALA